MIFKYSQFRNFLTEIKKYGEAQLFRNWNGDRVFLLRHDVDFDITLAHKLAVIENENNIVATYFILTTCESYNILCSKNRSLLREIKSMGHEIGLHFDPSLYTGNYDEIVKKEIDILSFAVEDKIKSISLHAPSVHGQYPMFEGYVNAYHPTMFSDANYISDSNMRFRGKDPFEFIKNIKTNMIQILLHPLHFSEDGTGYDDILCKSFVRYINSIDANFRAMNFNTYPEHIGESINLKLKKYL